MHQFTSDISKTMNTPSSRPDHIACAEVNHLLIDSRFHAPAYDGSGLFKRMVVRVNLCAGHVLNEKEQLMNSAE